MGFLSLSLRGLRKGPSRHTTRHRTYTRRCCRVAALHLLSLLKEQQNSLGEITLQRDVPCTPLAATEGASAPRRLPKYTGKVLEQVGHAAYQITLVLPNPLELNVSVGAYALVPTEIREPT